jgi:hypothetical protein
VTDALDHKFSEALFYFSFQIELGFLVLIKVTTPNNPIALAQKPRTKSQKDYYSGIKKAMQDDFFGAVQHKKKSDISKNLSNYKLPSNKDIVSVLDRALF